jgi:hypothetical protein
MMNLLSNVIKIQINHKQQLKKNQLPTHCIMFFILFLTNKKAYSSYIYIYINK